MNDKVYPSAKPAAPDGGGVPALPPNKAQLYNARRPAYRPQPPPPPRRSRGRGCWCRCCLWTAVLILVIAVVAAIAGAVFYLIYRPHLPSISVNALQLSKFNLTGTSVTSVFNVSMTARNPNSRISFVYDQAKVLFLSGNIDVGDGSFPGFTQSPKNVTRLGTVVASSNNAHLDRSDVSGLRRKNLPLQIQIDTKIRAEIGKVRTGKLGVRVSCDGIAIPIPGETATSASVSDVKCKLDPQIKIIRWTIY